MSDSSDNNELERINKFVAVAPQNSYNIDQYKGQICRQLPGGQEECLKLNLECKGLLFYSILFYLAENRE